MTLISYSVIELYDNFKTPLYKTFDARLKSGIEIKQKPQN